MNSSSPKLYLLTNDDPIDTLLDKLERAFDTGVISLLQVRRKNTLQQFDLVTLYQEAELLVELASHFGTGLHLGQRDGSVRVAREILGEQVVIGRTCHSDMALFREAKKDGATYGAMGTVFSSITKPKAKTVSAETLQKAAKIDFPLCVIGGVTLDNSEELHHKMNGERLDYIAVTADIMNQPSDTIAKKCLGWKRVLDNWHFDYNR